MYERFVQLLQENNVTTYKVAKETGIGQSSFSDWKTGRATPKTDKLQKVADYFNVSLDYLTGNSEFRTKEEMFAHWEEKHNPDGKLAEEVRGLERLNEKDERDIAKDMSYLLEQFDSQEALMFDGEVLDEETKQLLLQSLEHSMRIGKAMAKQKYTPKKYRK